MNFRSCIPYLILATICCASSVGIVMVAMLALASGEGTISDHGMFAIAGMALAPAAIAVGIAPHIPCGRI